MTAPGPAPAAAGGGPRPGQRIALLPLDERPVCTRLPAMVAAVAGLRVETPPAHLMPRLRTPGDHAALGRWLADQARPARPVAAVVALETLGYGGLIASRTAPGTVAGVTARWAPLRTLADAGVPVHAVALVTRTPDSADALEEPAYWDPHGPDLHRLSAHLHQTALGAGDPATAEPPLPPGVRADFVRRRLRNHALNLAALELLAAGTVTSLVVGADDTAPYALATAELDWLRNWAGWLAAGDAVSVRPGADEATTVFVARTVLDRLGTARPKVAVEAAEPAGLERVAPYENGPVGQTATRQIEACGAVAVAAGEPCDLRLLVHTPDGSGADWAIAPPAARPAAAHDRAAALARRAAALLDAGEAVAVADCGQPNGADPLLVRALRRHGVLERLAGYAGWNTAGNTLGTAAAHGVTAVAARWAGRFDRAAHRRLLLHRLLEDWAYMTRARTAGRAALGSDPARHESLPADSPVLGVIEGELAACRRELGAFTEYRPAPGSVRLPWQRTFEADFDLTAHPSVEHT
ncbi:DUF4127 family protein [Streptomyces sp. MAR4 CNX-425]|uniref:DUF4127 family protein n=1 Tax=Streptomyces sp. MAR4 CNX-425 TaxID=3406343 RepID=UPI003B5028C2